mmetsp:Transcript_37001/g.59626  ORF Transcript_37001/g.59626 Transcript_37001/m.59626 type:complete len:204 (-) Transcript_37001:363-974(-)
MRSNEPALRLSCSVLRLSTSNCNRKSLLSNRKTPTSLHLLWISRKNSLPQRRRASHNPRPSCNTLLPARKQDSCRQCQFELQMLTVCLKQRVEWRALSDAYNCPHRHRALCHFGCVNFQQKTMPLSRASCHRETWRLFALEDRPYYQQLWLPTQTGRPQRSSPFKQATRCTRELLPSGSVHKLVCRSSPRLHSPMPLLSKSLF